MQSISNRPLYVDELLFLFMSLLIGNSLRFKKSQERLTQLQFLQFLLMNSNHNMNLNSMFLYIYIYCGSPSYLMKRILLFLHSKQACMHA